MARETNETDGEATRRARPPERATGAGVMPRAYSADARWMVVAKRLLYGHSAQQVTEAFDGRVSAATQAATQERIMRRFFEIPMGGHPAGIWPACRRALLAWAST